jgi:hypothetical protein
MRKEAHKRCTETKEMRQDPFSIQSSRYEERYAEKQTINQASWVVYPYQSVLPCELTGHVGMRLCR